MKLTGPLVGCLFAVQLLGASEIPPLVFPAGVGVNIHFVTGHQRDLDLIAGAGFKFIRMDFGWEGIERVRGQYDWSGYDELLGNLEQRGLHAVFILDYSNPLYEASVESVNPLNGQPHHALASPQHPESVAAYARWAAASAKHFHGRHIIWELWNEPNIQFWSPKPDVHQYTTLALAACREVRQAEPKATIVGPASSGFPWPFLETFLQSGVLQYLDAVSVHPYREYRRGPETAGADYQRLRGLIDRFAPASRKGKIPVLSGEWGYATHTKGVSIETQAAFAARQQLANVLDGVPLSIWYDWKNDGDNPAEREDNFGTVLPNLEPKPSYHAIETLTRELKGYHIARRLPGHGDGDYLLLCEQHGDPAKLVAWTTAEPHEVAVSVRSHRKAKVSGITDSGVLVLPLPQGGRITLHLTSFPQYLTLENIVVR